MCTAVNVRISRPGEARDCIGKGGVMARQVKMKSPLVVLSNKVTCPERISLDNPREVMAEVKKIVLLMFKQFEFNQFERVFDDILRLFAGTYPGYNRCNTLYHDLNHTMDCLLVTAKLMHGAWVNGIIFDKQDVTLGLI